MNLLQTLNEQQKEGVVNTEGPTLLIAGAGSGKTRVLTYRIAYLIEEKKVDPFNIMALTFTNKAAQEMRSRIENLVGTDAKNLWMGTFHSVFARILRAEANKLGYPSNFSIYDTNDSKSLLKTIIKEQNLDIDTYKPNVVYNRISGAKNRLISWQEYIVNPILTTEDRENAKPELSTLYKIYCERCFRAGAMDFDDLLFNTNILFKNHLDILNKYQQRFHYVMVDEFQDTNISQYQLTKKLAAVRQNICVVGDDAQSIYGFRGADIQNILNFEKDYPDLKVIKLEQNYRSTKTIVEVANSIILNNKSQLKKNIWTDNTNGELIKIINALSDNEEGKLIASSIFEEKMRNQAQNNEFAILYRTNSQSRAIEEALRRINIEYKIVGGMSFYARKEIKDVMAYMRFSINENDEEAFKRIINYPKRGIGGSSVDKIIVTSYEQNISIWEVLKNSDVHLPSRISNKVKDFVSLIKRFKIEIEKNDAYEASANIAKWSGLLKDLYEDKTVEGLSKYENVQELLNAIKEFVDNDENQDKSLGAFLQEVALLTGQDSEKNEINQDRITLMTIHMAKGLEFNYVYIVGLEEDLFPSQMMLSSRSDLEEERRLFYVAITRAKRKLFLAYATTRYRFGRIKPCEPSRFISEIDQKFINMTRSKTNIRTQTDNSQYAKKFISNMRINTSNSDKLKKTSYIPSSDFSPSDTNNLKKGMRVEHPKFGFGKVDKIDDIGSNKKATVVFDEFGEKTLLLSFAKLKIHS